MGMFAVKFVVSHPLRPARRVELEGLVDTGALFTQIPGDLLSRIGIIPSGYRSVHYADGTGAVVPVAKADVTVQGVETATMILCGTALSLVLLGVTTLETLGFGVDPIHKTLIPIDAPMATTACAGSATTAVEDEVRRDVGDHVDLPGRRPSMSSTEKRRSGNAAGLTSSPRTRLSCSR